MLDISDRIPPSTVAVFESIHNEAQKEGVSFFLIGAAARDMLFRDAFGLPVRRATRDIDVAIRVADWHAYDRLVMALISTGDFKATGLSHRLLFKGGEEIDIIPFGPIAGTKQSIAWPLGRENVMGVLGFEEAFRDAVLVTLNRDAHLEIAVSTPAGLAVMKLISWDESYPTRGKDGEDFYYIAENYLDTGNDDRLYGDGSDLLEMDIFDRAIAGARLLGRDMSCLARNDTRRRIGDILVREFDPSGSLKLVTDIVGTSITLHEKFERVLEMINSLRVGFTDARKGL